MRLAEDEGGGTLYNEPVQRDGAEGETVFTGIVERRGEVVSIQDHPGGREIVIAPLPAGGLPPWDPVALGESIAVSGVCLTAARLRDGGPRVAFDAVPETLSRTTLGKLSGGDQVNLERSLRAGDRLGGHFVYGHVDGLGVVLGREEEGDQVLFRIGAPPALVAQTIPKGSIAVDGISLTVIDVDRVGNTFTFAAIPHTLLVTTLGQRVAGESVNLETDPLGKWVLQCVREVLGGGGLTLPGG